VTVVSALEVMLPLTVKAFGLVGDVHLMFSGDPGLLARDALIVGWVQDSVYAAPDEDAACGLVMTIAPEAFSVSPAGVCVSEATARVPAWPKARVCAAPATPLTIQ
jgi:hypothetical protein